MRGRDEGGRCTGSGGREVYVVVLSVVVMLVEGWRGFDDAAEESDTRVWVVVEELPRLGVMVMLELREACEFMQGRRVAASDANPAS